MYKPNKEGIVRVEGDTAIIEAHKDPNLLEVGGNDVQKWAEFRLVGFQEKKKPEKKKGGKE